MRIVFDTEAIPQKDYNLKYYQNKRFQLDNRSSYKYSLMNEEEKDNFVLSTSWVLSNVICICGKIIYDDKAESFKLYSDDEKKLLTVFIDDVINKNKNALFVTYNGLTYDVPLIMRACSKHDIKIKNENFTNLRRFSKFPHYDCCAILGNWGAENVDLDTACKYFGIKSSKENETNASNIITSSPEKIKEYCYDDADATDQIYLKMINNF